VVRRAAEPGRGLGCPTLPDAAAANGRFLADGKGAGAAVGSPIAHPRPTRAGQAAEAGRQLAFNNARRTARRG